LQEKVYNCTKGVTDLDELKQRLRTEWASWIRPKAGLCCQRGSQWRRW